MSGLIKSSAANNARSLGTLSASTASETSPHEPAVPNEMTILQERLTALQAEHASCRDAVAAARHAGEEAGYRRALEEIETGRAEELDRLETTGNRALEHFARHIVDAESLAVLIAETVLEKMLLDSAHYRDLVRDALVARIREIDQTSIVRITVPVTDFPEQAELDQVADLCGLDQVVIRQDDDMATGHCQIDLTLGTLDVGLRQQWERLKGELRSSTGPGNRA